MIKYYIQALGELHVKLTKAYPDLKLGLTSQNKTITITVEATKFTKFFSKEVKIEGTPESIARNLSNLMAEYEGACAGFMRHQQRVLNV